MIYPCPKPKPRGKAKRVRRGLHQGQPLRKTRMKCGAGSKRRGGHAFPKNVDEPYRAFIRGLPCILAGRVSSDLAYHPHECGLSRTQACHVKSRGAGGKDRKNLYPGCSIAHFEQHALGIPAFEKRWEVDLRFIARQLTEVYEAEKFPCP